MRSHPSETLAIRAGQRFMGRDVSGELLYRRRRSTRLKDAQSIPLPEAQTTQIKDSTLGLTYFPMFTPLYSNPPRTRREQNLLFRGFLPSSQGFQIDPLGEQATKLATFVLLKGVEAMPNTSSAWANKARGSDKPISSSKRK